MNDRKRQASTNRTYSTGLWIVSGQQAKELKGRGFEIHFSSEKFTGTWEDFQKHRIQTQGHVFGTLTFKDERGPIKTYDFGGEALIKAKNRLMAQRVLHVIGSACSLLKGLYAFDVGTLIAVPLDTDDWEDIHWMKRRPEPRPNMSSGEILEACEIAAKVSRNKHLQYALLKIYLSYQLSSASTLELNPHFNPRKFRVESDLLWHVYFANAITLAYSAIEEMQLEIRASQKTPSTLNDGSWNPVVKEDLEARLRKAKIDLNKKALWMLRGSPTRVERAKAVAVTTETRWSRNGTAVRDPRLPVVDALKYASWLRSKLSTHRFSDETPSLTVYDTQNCQYLAARLLLEHLGYYLHDD